MAMLPLSAGAIGPTEEALHQPASGSLPPSSKNVELVGRVELTDVDDGIADVSALGTFAYVGAFAGECFNPNPAAGPGVHVVDFSIPQLPRKVGFIPAGDGSFVGEGVQTLSVKTKKFTGDLLLMSLEPCRSNAQAGIALWDITDPLSPIALAVGKGDTTPKSRSGASAHSTHSAFMWAKGKNLYAVLVDNEESGSRDVDILDITNPRKPKKIAETGLTDWPKANGKARQKSIGGHGGSFLHDMIVKKIGKKYLMLASYWDTGWVVLDVTNPKRPKYVKDSNYPKRDPLTKRPTEGNAHQAVWSHDNKLIIGANEDLVAKLTFVGAMNGSGQAKWFRSSLELPGAKRIGRGQNFLLGPSVFGGFGCPPFSVPSPTAAGPVSPGETPFVVLQEGLCDRGTKLAAAEAAGWDAAILVASHEASRFGLEPRSMPCSPLEGITVGLHVVCLDHGSFHALFQQEPQFIDPIVAEPKVGDRGDTFGVFTFGDGTWGDLRLINAKTMKQIDQYQITEALDRRYEEGYGTLTVHEVKLDPRRRSNIVYASWYSGGLRVMTYSKRKGLREVGHYIGDFGPNYWGVYPVAQDDGPPLVLLSDMNHGLDIVRYTG